MAAEGGLLEEPRHEAVILDHVNILLLESALPAPQFVGEGVDVAGPEGVLARVLRIVRHGAADAADAPLMLPIDDRSTSMMCELRERLLAGDDADLSGVSSAVRVQRGEAPGSPDERKAADGDDGDRTRARKLSHGAPTDDGMSRARGA